MKLQPQTDGSWCLKHRSYVMLAMGGIFLASVPLALTSSQEDAGVAALILLVMGLASLYFFAEFSTLTIDSQWLRHRRLFLFFSHEEVKPRSALVGIRLEPSPGRSRCQRLRFDLSDGGYLVMPRAFVGSTFGWRIEDIHQQVLALFPELQAGADDEVHALLAAGQKLQAIKMVREQHGIGLLEARQMVEELAAKKPGTR